MLKRTVTEVLSKTSESGGHIPLWGVMCTRMYIDARRTQKKKINFGNTDFYYRLSWIAWNTKIICLWYFFSSVALCIDIIHSYILWVQICAPYEEVYESWTKFPIQGQPHFEDRFSLPTHTLVSLCKYLYCFYWVVIGHPKHRFCYCFSIQNDYLLVHVANYFFPPFIWQYFNDLYSFLADWRLRISYHKPWY